MILEIATLDIVPRQETEYLAAFNQAQEILAAQKGYISCEVQRCIEMPSRFLVMVKWHSLEDHTIGFRESADFARWRAFVSPFFSSPPDIKHYQLA